MSDLELFLYLAPIIIGSLVLHELAHAIVATKLGDATPRDHGRLTLNPIVHLDPLGTAMFVITYFLSNFIFGWARPVIVNPRNFRHPQRGMAIVAAAGPATNFLIAIVCAAVILHGWETIGLDAVRVLDAAYQVNIVLGIFNLIPIPPLDGSRIVGAFMDDATYARWSALDAYGMFALFGLIFIFRDEFSQLFASALDTSTDVVRVLVGG
jgi:Zn-dependent protease